MSTFTSRRITVDAPQYIPEVVVLGIDEPFPVFPPFWAEPGVYRAELNEETHTATIEREDAS
jgi:hypothetical protein